MIWLTIIGVGLVTFVYRAAFLFFLTALNFPQWARQILRFVPAAALTALIVPELLMRSGTLAFTWQNERLLAGLIAIAIALWTRSVGLTLAVGMVTLYLLQQLL